MKSAILVAALLMSASSLAASDASYEVPGFPPGSSMYDMDFKLDFNGDQVSARYELPLDLTGARNRIEAVGTFSEPGVVLLKGPKAELICNLSLSRCDARYRGLQIDLDAVKIRLEKRGLNPEQVNFGLSVSRRFEGDPIGVIHLSND